VIIGGLVTHLYGETLLGVASALMTFTILVFSEVLPKNIGHRLSRGAAAPYRLSALVRVRRAARTRVLYVCKPPWCASSS